MGLTSGGMLALVLMSERRQQINFTIMLGLALLLTLGGGVGLVAQADNLAAALTNALVLTVLSFALGYTLTAFSVLSPRSGLQQAQVPQAQVPQTRLERPVAVILLMPGEPPNYSAWSAGMRFELADDPQDVPPILLRPFYMSDLKNKYKAIGHSPYRGHQQQLCEEIQSRLESDYRVSLAFYSDHPTLAEAVVQAVEAGAHSIILAHVRVTDPPDPVMRGDLLEGVNLGSRKADITQVGPMWVSNLLPQIYVRRVIEAVPQAANATDDIGLLLIGRGHTGEDESGKARREQEKSFQNKVMRALLHGGFNESRIAMGWVRQSPTCAEALQALINAGCRSVYWIPSSFAADGITTLYDIPAQINGLAAAKGIKLFPLPAWNADELVAEEVASYVRAAAGARLHAMVRA